MRALFLLLALAPLSSAADPAPVPELPRIVIAPGGKEQPSPAPVAASVKLAGAEFELLTLQGAAGPITWDISSPDSFGVPVKLFELKPKESVVGVRVGSAVPDRHEAPDGPSVAVFAVNTGRAVLSAWGIAAGKPVKLATFAIDANVGPRPPPKPPEPDPPEPKPPDPKPPVVTSFRVIWVYESGDTIPANQTAVMDAKAVRDYLNAKTTPAGGWAGWRQFDPQHEAANDTPIMKALWQSVKPHITTIPCMVVEVNGKAEIVPFPKTPAEAIATLRSYGGP